MRQIILVIIFCLNIFLIVNPALATPPHDILLNYDVEQKRLSISLKHPSEDTHKHYIRRLYIYKNQEKEPIKKIAFASQKKASGLDETVALDLKAGDIVTIKAFCSDAGTAEASLNIPATNPENKQTK